MAQQSTVYPPPPESYPPPAQGYPQGAYIAPPPAGYPSMDVSANPQQAPPVETRSRGEDGFWKGCCAAICCCCAIDCCL